MVGRNPRYEIDIMVVDMLEKKYPQSLRYKEFEKEVNLRCEGKNPSSATLTDHLTILCGRESQYTLYIDKKSFA